MGEKQAVAEESTPRVTLSLQDVSRRFGRRMVFSKVSAQAGTGQVLVIAGSNGSGKSTLTRIIAGLLMPSSGSASVSIDGVSLDTIQRRRHLGLVAPDLMLYAELTGVENLQFFARLRGITLDRKALVELLERVGLRGRGRDFVGNYSSGMRQRLKYAFALLHRPPLLLLDEPTANLDAQGVAMVEQVVAEQRDRGLVVIATNEPREVEWGDQVVRLNAAIPVRIQDNEREAAASR